MKRLTNKREADQQRKNYEKRLEQGYPRNIAEERFLKLAAYEDAGLEPEEVKDSMNRWENAAKIAGLIKQYGSKHLVELIEAEQNGMLAVLPCKNDDTVYVAFMGRVFPLDVISVILHGNTPTFKAQHGIHLVWVFGTDDIGKTVFLTREEAEAALGGGGADET